MRILIADYAAQASGQGGALWALQQYATGFRRLGHNVQVTDKPDGEFDLVINTSGLLAPDAIADEMILASGGALPMVSRAVVSRNLAR